MICPKTIIFTKDKEDFLKLNENNKNLFIKNSFYNLGGVKDCFVKVKNFLKNELNKKIPSDYIIEKDDESSLNQTEEEAQNLIKAVQVANHLENAFMNYKSKKNLYCDNDNDKKKEEDILDKMIKELNDIEAKNTEELIKISKNQNPTKNSNKNNLDIWNKK